MSDPEYERVLARSYDAVTAALRDGSGDIAFYLELAQQSGGPVLELGCGTGRILLPTARLGLECVGLDASREMLAVLRDKQPPPNVRLVWGRMQDAELGNQSFALVTAPFRSLQHLLDTESQLAALRNVRRSLAPGGVFAFDVFDPKLERLAKAQVPERLGARFTVDGKRMRRYDSATRDSSQQVMTAHFRFVGGVPELTGNTEVRLRWYYRYELEHLLARAGFEHVQFYRDFQRTPWRAGHETVVIARSEARGAPREVAGG